MRALIIIPCFNEEGTLSRVLEETLRWRGEADILIVDDGSTDQSPQIFAQFPKIRVLRHRNNLGYGRALMDGFHIAMEENYEACLTMDCDEQHEPHMIPHFLRSLPGWDIISGSRYLCQSYGEPPADRYQINMEITAILKKLTGYPLTDSFCGFKAYRVSALCLLDLTEESYGFPVQFWLQAARHGLKMREIPVSLIYKDYSRHFPGELNDPRVRRQYYLEIIEREEKKWHDS